MKRLICLFIVVIMITFSISFSAMAQFDIPEYIRVGLFYNTTAKQALTISGENVCLKGDSFDSVTDNSYTIGIGESGFLINNVLYQVNNVEFFTENNIINVDGKPYRGYIRLLLTDKGINVINCVKLEEYLYGVVPLEMSTGWPVEALKAQAVCARTYAATQLGKFEKYGFDVTDNTLSQVYGGINAEKEDCTKAVDETRGMVATYNGNIAEVFYFATSNGTTLDVKDVWGSTTYPYLVPVDDSLQSSVIKDNGKWTVNYTKDELTDLFNKKGLDLGDIVDVNVDEYNKQGAVMKLTVKGTNESKSYTLGKTRDILSLRSQTYSINKITDKGSNIKLSVLTAAGLESSEIKMNVISADGINSVDKKVNVLSKDGTQVFESQDGEFTGIQITGYGYGHGIGMSQNGAKAFANAGYTYKQIIEHYFTGVEVKCVLQEELLND